MGALDERTPLRKAEGGGPPYMFMTSPNRLYRKQIHQFQCLICLTFLLLFLTAIAITLLQSVEDDIVDNNVDNSSSIEPLLTLSWPIPDKVEGKWSESISESAIDNALSSAKMSLAAKDELEAKMIGLPPDTPSYKHQRSIKTSLRATYLARTGYMMDVATKNVLKSSGDKLNKKSVGRSSDLKNSILPSDVCGIDKIKPFCASSPYRSVDGSCNNLNFPDTWGVALQPFRRALPPDYGDGVSEPRKATDGSELPSAREVSITVHRPEYRGDNNFTVMLAVWGQFLDHDISATAISQGKDGSTISCCGKLPSEMHPECFPVSVGADDPGFPGISCLEFVRSAPAPSCSLGPREQLNQASSYIDGSVVYGNNNELMSSLRSYENGQLRMTVTPDGRTLLPISTDPTDGCNKEEENAKGRYCFASGDARANENIHLTTMHLIMARQHNSIAAQLSAINPNWDDETLFQESRKIIAAQMQHITYNEFLPVLLGDKIMNKLEMSSDKDGYYDKYDPTINPSISNNFATAAFRFAHTLLPGLMRVMKNMTDDERVELHQLLFDPYKLYSPGYLDSSVVGAMNTPLERMDNYFNKELTEKLFKQPSKPCGLDLVSLNIQRGRDHGLPGYPAWREHCGLSRPSSFDDLKGYVDQDSLMRMSSLYKSVDDIDLYTGALSEYPTKEGMLGPTLTCLIADQFKRLKAGDRFWYETSEKPQAFSPAQLNEIRKSSLAGIICNSGDAVDSVRPKVMLGLALDNEQVPCRQIQQPDLTVWVNAVSEKTALKSSEMFPVSAVMGLHVKQASISSDDGPNWVGQPPVNIPLSIFNGPSLGPTHVLPPTADWSISSATIVNTKLSIAGTYSAVSYAFGKSGVFDFSSKHITGKFALDADILWNNTDISSILHNDGSFSSSIFFSARSPKNVSFNIAKKFVQVNPVKKAPSFGPGVLAKTSRSAVVFAGNYSLDKTLFSWNGNLTVTLPMYVFSDLVNQNLNVPKDMSFGSAEKAAMTARALFKVSSGSIIENFSDGSQKLFWNGDLPLKISTLSPYGAPLPRKWTAIITVTETSPSIKGTFSVPTFSNGFGFNVTWTTGEFNFIADSLFNTSFDTIIKPGLKYQSKIILSSVAKQSSIDPSFSWNDLDDFGVQSSMEEFLTDSLDVVDSVIPITVVLQGMYSPDKTVFNWFGQGVINVKNTTKLLENTSKQMKKLNSPLTPGPLFIKSRFGGSVTGGVVSTNSGGFFNFGNTVWSGNLPVAIPVKYVSGIFSSYVFSLGVHWSGDLIGNTVRGKYSIPQFSGSWFPSPSIQWINGTFSFDVLPLWNATLQDVFVPGASYYSKISFQGMKSPLDDYDQNSFQTNLLSSMQQGIGTELFAPIILKGTYSPDKSFFYWTGDFIISFQSGLILDIKNPSLKTSSVVSKPVSYKALFKVSGGSINEDGMMQPFWNGNFPLSVPTVGPYGKPLPKKWTAIITVTETSPTIKGTFSVPSFTHGLVFNVSWTTGDFNFIADSLFNSSLKTILKPGFKYQSKIILSSVAKQSSVDPSVSWNDLGQSGIENLMEEFVSDSFDVVDSVIPITIVLQGMYSPDKTVFDWFGQGIISIKNITQFSDYTAKQQKMLNDPLIPGPLSIKNRFGGLVTSGSVSTNSGGFFNFGSTIWSGTLPVSIPVKYFSGNFSSYMFSLGVYWSGSLVGNTIRGDFSIPQFSGNWFPNPSVQWINGSFSFDIQPLWNSTLDQLFVPGSNYYSKISFQGSAIPVVTNDQFNPQSLLGSPSSSSFGSALFAPIILQGTYSPDKAFFYWSGKFIIGVHPSVVSEGRLSLTSASVPGKSNETRALFKINSGGIIEDISDGSQSVFWNGNFPLTIPMVDSFAKPISKKWTAIISISETSPSIKGTFSVPNFIHGFPFNISWTTGRFNFIVDSLFNTSLDSIIRPGFKYQAKIILSPFIQKSIADPFSLNDLGESSAKNSMEEFLSEGLDVIDSVIPITIVLQGMYSPDKTVFDWFGQGIINVKNITKFFENTAKQMQLLGSPLIPGPSLIKSRFGGSVTGGVVSTNSNGFFSFGNTVWSGALPVAIPVKYVSGIFSSYVFSLGVHWSGDLIGNTVRGKYSIPQFSGSWFPSPSIQWINGTFSFDVLPLWNATLQDVFVPGANYYSKISFQGIKTPVATDAEYLSLKNLLSATQQTIGTELSAPIILKGTYSPDKSLFNWSGDFIISFRSGLLGISDTSFLNDPSVFSGKQDLSFILGTSSSLSDFFPLIEGATGKSVGGKGKTLGANVTSGNINLDINNETTVNLWTGSLPLHIPIHFFDNLNNYNYCVPWNGSVLGSAFQGNFSFPNISSNDSGINIQWFNGDFQLHVLPLWFSSLTGTVVPGKKYCATLHLQGNSTSFNRTQSFATPVNIGSFSPSVIILKGNYSADESMFYWNGQLIISFKNASSFGKKITLSLSSDNVVTIDPPKPTKAPKPPKPRKESVSFTVTSGSITAGFEGTNATQVWDGVLPVQIPLDSILDKYSYAPMAQVSWSGKPSKTNLEGSFSIPINTVNGTVTQIRNWIGNFSLQFIIKWSGDMEAMVDPTLTYNCRLLFNEIRKKSTLLSSGNSDLQATGEVPNGCNMLLFGTFYKKPFYCSILPFMCPDDSTIFIWSGDAIITFILPPIQPIQMANNQPASIDKSQLQMLPNQNYTEKRVIGKVLSGTMTAGLTGESKNVIWSGSIPATIPLPVFWSPVTDLISKDDGKVYGHGAIWSGSIFGMTVHGTFSLPQYTFNGAKSSLRWWDGDFSFQVMSLWDIGLGDIITPGLKFYSRVIFRDIKNATNLLQSLSPSQDEIDLAYRAPLVLLGTYSMDGKTFYWSGQFVFDFYNVPDVNIYSY